MTGTTSDSADERLSKLLAVTDTELARLGAEELQIELLERIRDVLDADTVAVLVHEEPSDYLVAQLARGLEEEVRQGVRIPIGVGFAGSIAALRQPVRLDRVDKKTVTNPILWEKGIRTMLGVPLLSGKQLLGVLHVGRLDDRPFGDVDTQVLSVAGERVVTAMLSANAATERAAADLLERSLLPTRFPALEGLEFGGRYAPSEDRMIGGDWYDVFTLPSGDLWLVTGDVAGHSLQAAVRMGRVRSALRAYALLGGGPAETLALTDRKVHHFEIDTMVTVVCAVTRPPYDRFQICSAGHLPPVLAQPDRPTSLVELKVGPPLGAVRDAPPRVATEIDFPPGSLLALYTDGLVERRGEVLDVGLRRLRDTIRADAPDLVCRETMQRLVADRIPADDIAMLAVRRPAA
ncbi:MAG TPA: GAF domain-containing SpoIIE family protein phosphatase [Jatrophihabitantaceae bacterium]|nr:GAF domain-containing SpoIIE family protein phosphatase [Jatrophihabitantaceae bacterium]